MKYGYNNTLALMGRTYPVSSSHFFSKILGRGQRSPSAFPRIPRARSRSSQSSSTRSLFGSSGRKGKESWRLTLLKTKFKSFCSNGSFNAYTQIGVSFWGIRENHSGKEFINRITWMVISCNCPDYPGRSFGVPQEGSYVSDMNIVLAFAM